MNFAVTRNGATLAGEHLGTGVPVVFLHAGVADRRMWTEQLEHLGQQFHAVAYDRRGFGETRTDDVAFSHVEDLRSIVDELALKAPILVGCSQGGRLAIDYTLAHPRDVAALVLVSTAISGAPETVLPRSLAALFDEIEEAEKSGDLERVNALEAHVWLDGPSSAPARVSGAARRIFLDMNRIALQHAPLTRTLTPPNAHDRVADIDVPVLLVNGDLDFPHIVQRHAELATRIRGARLAVIEGTAHLPNLERGDSFNALVTAFCMGLSFHTTHGLPHVR